MTPYRFFLVNAGYSWDKETETRAQGMRRCAKSLAAAEKWARDHGYTFEWEVDLETNSSDFSDETPAWELWNCVMRDADGKPCQSLCAIDFGRHGQPRRNGYRRVVEAELAVQQHA